MDGERSLREQADEEPLAESEEQIDEAKRVAEENQEVAESIADENVPPPADPPGRETGFSPS
ncbi:hypothetical protein SAMN05216266_11184 [Amycolatopsis marina]|uniref:Uncharacterized protein n=1 Tax=Amycolatopsis marina TaxID=490629 RepID=A0A1I1AYZ1_9PSEU|nr:hypothetical protein [Amycolatopsis marina]SFB43315.1 hypothetical protein SAMN05216266_11184 [Amycolatopsis marina]